MMKLKGRTALVTGAGGGIGRAIALSLARRGCHLALADIDEEGLAGTAGLASGVRASRHRLDVADGQAVEALPETIAAEHGGLDLLVNNAGVAMSGSFAQIAQADFEWLFSINFWGVVRMTRAFLPLLDATAQESGEARIVNLSSLYGLIAPPGQTAYAASKFAVRGFSQALAHEFAGTRIGLTLVHPGGVATRIADSARAPETATDEETARWRDLANGLLKMPPEEAGEIIVRAAERRRARVIVGNDARATALIERFAPVSYWRILTRLQTSRTR